MPRLVPAPIHSSIEQISDLLFVPPGMNMLDETPAVAQRFAALVTSRIPAAEAKTLQNIGAIEDALRAALSDDLMRSYILLVDALAAQMTAERDTAYELGVAVGRRLARQEAR